jgi:lactate permease
MIWQQNYDPLHNAVLSTLVAALPICLLLGLIGFLKLRPHLAALWGLAAAMAIALWVYRMPAPAAIGSTIYGAAFGLFPIGWIILNVIFLYQLTVDRGLFSVLRNSLATVAPDPRVQLILIAFSFGAFIEGMAGFGAPVAITAAILIQLGFRPLHASVLALIANTAPVAFGSMGIPITTLEQVTGLDARKVSAMVGRQLPFFSVLIPFWVVAAYAGFRGMWQVWPAALVAGVSFALPQFLISNFHGPWLVDIISGACSIGATVVLLRFWRPSTLWKMDQAGAENPPGDQGAAIAAEPGSGMVTPPEPRAIFQAWTPWLVLTSLLLVWGTPQFKTATDKILAPRVAVAGLDGAIQRVPPVALPGAKPESAVFRLNLLSATGTGIFCAAVLAGFIMGCSPRDMARTYRRTIWKMRFSLVTIAAMLALGNLTKYSGTDATLGLALAHTGSFYPFFGTLLGWLGVALTGSDTASNVLFGSLQKITAEQTGISPILMGAANSSGGVMGKMIDAQSIVVASTATNSFGNEGQILRAVFFHSVALATLMGIWVYLQATAWPFTKLVVH